MQQIKNIIFDLGGIFLNIDYPKTEKAFIDLGITNFPELYNQHHASDLFELLETGKITPDEFYHQFAALSPVPVSPEQIKEAWNAMLGTFPPERIDWLQQIKTRYNIYLFSNTNKIHHDAFTETFAQLTGNSDFDRHFIKAWYSHTIGVRKPYPDSFRHVLSLANLDAAETLFIDDTYKNIEGAREAGLQTIHLVAPMTLLDLSL